MASIEYVEGGVILHEDGEDYETIEDAVNWLLLMVEYESDPEVLV